MLSLTQVLQASLSKVGDTVTVLGDVLTKALGVIPGLPPTAVLAHYLSIAIVFTTIHAQDFQDEAGDRLEKRLTIPIVMPQFGRLSMPIGLLVWSWILAAYWSRSMTLSWAVISLGALVGGRFYFLRTPESDRASYVIYNVSHVSSPFTMHALISRSSYGLVWRE